jgi:hypothetical protein
MPIGLPILAIVPSPREPAFCLLECVTSSFALVFCRVILLRRGTLLFATFFVQQSSFSMCGLFEKRIVSCMCHAW